MKPSILLATPLLAATEATLEREFACHRLPGGVPLARDVAAAIRGIATFNRADATLIGALPKLEIVASCTVGVDGIDRVAANQRGILVTNTPEVLDDCVAETAIALVLNLLHRFPAAERWLRAGDWARRGPFALGSEMRGKTMGILGLGRIGEAIAQRALAFGMRIRYHNRQQKDSPYPYDPDPIALARNCDLLMVTTPGGTETRSLVDARVLEALGPEGYLVNIARGSVVDEAALLAALRGNRIKGAGIDVFENEPHINPEFFGIENAVLFPHLGSASLETRTAMGELMTENLRRHFAGQALLTPVN